MDDPFSSSKSSESTPLRPLSSLTLAAWSTERGFLGLPPLKGVPSSEAREAYLKYTKARNPEGYIALFFVALLSFVEVPHWCVSEEHDVYTVSCSLPEGAHHMYLSNLPYLPVPLTLALEMPCLFFLLRLSRLERAYLSALGERETLGVKVRFVAPLLCLLAAAARAMPLFVEGESKRSTGSRGATMTGKEQGAVIGCTERQRR